MPSELKQLKFCNRCGKYPVYNSFHKLCVYCNQKRLDEAKTPKFTNTRNKSRTDANSQAKKVIKEAMLRSSGGLCTGCLNRKPLTLSHIIPISLRKDLELDQDNLLLECMDCHTVWEHGTLEKKKALLNYQLKENYIKKVDPNYYERKFNI